MSNISTKSSIADQAKTKAQLLAELNELRRRVAQWEAAEPLNQSEERYRSVITAMAEGVVMQQRSGEIVACNPAAEQILGLTSAQMMGRTSVDPHWRTVHEDGSPFPGETHPGMVTLQTGQPQRDVIMGVHKPDGRLTWILINSEPMFQPGAGEPYAVVATFTDITAQRQAEEKLRESEERLRTVVENSRDGINLLDLRTGKYIWMTPSQVAMTGFTAEEMNDFPVEEAYARVHPDDRDISIGQQQQMAAGQTPGPTEYRWQVKSGEYRWFSDNRGLVRDPQGNPIALVGISRDITERKQMEEALRQSERKFRRVVEHSNDAIVLSDETGRTIEWNLAAERIIGLKRAEALEQTAWDIMFRVLPAEQQTAEWYEQLKTQWLNYFQTGQHPSLNQVVELEIQHPDGSRRIVQPARFSIKTEHGFLLGAVIRDVTELKQTEAKLRESEARFRAVLANNSVVVFDQDRELRYTHIYNPNPNFMAQRIVGKTDADLLLPAEAAQLTDIKRQVLVTGVGERQVVQTTVAGEIFYYDLTVEPVFDRQGNITGVTCAAMDISERQRIETALKEQEHNLRTFFNTIDDLLFVLDEQGCIQWCNQTVIRKLGYTETELQGQSVLMVHPPEWRAEAGRIVRAMLEGQADYCPVPVLTKDGRQISVETRVQPGQWSGQKVIFGVTKDLSDLKASEERFSKAFQASPALMAISELDTHRFIAVNDAFLNTTGYQRHEVIGHTSAELELFAQAEQRAAALQLMQEQGYLRNFEVAMRAKSGEVHYGVFSAEHLRLQDRNLLLTVMSDITERKQMEEALRTSEQRLRQIIEYSADGVALADQTGRLIEWNPAIEQSSGLTRQAVVGRPIWEAQFGLLPAERRTPARLEQVKAGVQSYLQTGQNPRSNREGTIEIQRPDGSYRDIQTFDFSIKTEPGFLVGSVLRDVTEHKQTERIEAAQLAVNRILAESPEPEVALRRVLEAITVRLGWQLAHLWRLDCTGSRLVWQESWGTPDLPELVTFEQLSQGYTFEPGEGLTGAIWQTGRAIWDQDLHLVKGAPAALAAGLRSATGIPIIRDGVTVGVMTFFSRSARPLEERLLTTLTDLGRQIGQFLARKEAEESLRRYEHIVSTTPDWMALVDRSYVHRIVNQAFLIFGTKTCDQIIGHTVVELLGEAVFTTVIKPRLDQALAGETVQYQEWFDFPAAGRRFVNITYAPYREKDGTIAGVLVSGRDMTEAKLLEEHLQQVQKMGAIGQLAAGMAHHYNSMLTTIIGFTSLSLRTLPPGDPVAKNLERVLGTAERMAVLVRQLLAFAQKQLLQLKTANLNDLVCQLQGELKQMAPPPIEFTLDLAPEVGQGKVDLHQFEYLLRALVSNAVDAMPDGGRLTLTTTPVNLDPVEAGWYNLPPGHYTLLTVKDTGIGLSDEVKAHLFEPFFSTKDVGQGTGLGLAMSLGIARQHGGHLLAEGEPGQGATFMLYLPCQAPPAPPPAQAVPAQTILLIEAEPMVREFVAEILSDEGYTVLKAATTEVASQLMAGWPEVSVQLLLTPAQPNSPVLIEQLKAKSPGLKVIFLIDELADLSFELRGTQADFLLKPFVPSGLMQKIRAVQQHL